MQPETEGVGGGAAPAGELGIAVEPMRVADLAQQGDCGDGADAGLVTQGSAVAVEQVVDEPFEAADVAARCAVLVDERLELCQAVSAGGGRAGGGVEVFEAPQAALDLAVAAELVADLGGQLGRLVRDAVQYQCASPHKGSAVLEHGIVKKSGAWYTYEGEQLGQGRENAKRFLIANPEVTVEIDGRIRSTLGIGADGEADDDADVLDRLDDAQSARAEGASVD